MPSRSANDDAALVLSLAPSKPMPVQTEMQVSELLWTSVPFNALEAAVAKGMVDMAVNKLMMTMEIYAVTLRCLRSERLAALKQMGLMLCTTN